MNLKTKKVLFGLILLLALPALCLISFNLEFEKSDLETISGTLKSDPEFHKGGKNGPYLILHLNEFENQFNTDDFSYHILKKERLKSQVKIGDLIYLSIKKDESVSWVDKINRGLDIVRIMELWTDKEVYISIEDYNENRKEDYKLTYLFWVIGLGYYIYWLNKNKPSTTLAKKS